MSSPKVLTISSVANLFSFDGAYILAFSWLFGMSFWISFFGGTIAYKTLPRQQFGTLQHRTFPIYFVISIILSGGLLAQWIATHPSVLDNFTKPTFADVAQAYALGTVFLSQAANYFVVGPMTSKVMFQRHKQEKSEGKAYNDPEVSSEMKALNVKFAALHGWSSLANLFAVIALAFHGLWIGNTGLRPN
ncbi:hypothetical protein BD410DRAFT_781309 [Rickenella mellea]|uniref:TMEM205-like domain-containing protein n=1 Tax=Rickenella mellea TaxID=50990 RepID=A0A4Y7QMA1_9AGAM|nr:hypothetical protein BD410DRAFT_781309 [Rickenella mellea]